MAAPSSSTKSAKCHRHAGRFGAIQIAASFALAENAHPSQFAPHLRQFTAISADGGARHLPEDHFTA
jgi:hypothetical protein